jgi:cytochrome P450
MKIDIDADEILDEAIKVDLADPKLYAGERPERIWKTLRKAETPIRSSGFREHWAVTRHRQIEEVYRNGVRFSSEKGMHLGEKSTDHLAGEAAGGMSLLVTDDPAHFEMRRAMGAAFTPKMMRRLADSTLEIARGMVSDAASKGSVDFVSAVAGPFPAVVICDLLGVPKGDRSYVTRLTQAFSGSGYATSSAQLAAHAELFGYCDQLLMRKRRTPGDDVATVLANATMYGKPMSREVAVMNCHDLIAGGNETARHASSAAALSLVTHPAAWRKLRDGDVDVAGATEEILRFEAPVNHVMRVVLEDTEIGGATMRRGEYVTLWLRSANRDEEVFEKPDELVFARRPNKHLTFGLGSHFCVAASLARIEVGSIVHALLEIVGQAELSGQPKRLESNFFRGYRSVPLSLKRR